jgi:uncharacterized membrane protein
MGAGLTSAAVTASIQEPGNRLASLDLVRGAVMVLMTIDHAREYASGPGGLADPMDLSTVSPLLYTMRWVSHFCAPAFALLMGMSAWLSSQSRSLQEASAHLARRGLLLLLLEFTLIDWSWTFNPLWPRKYFQVIAALGCGLLALSVAIRAGRQFAGVTGALILLLHNLADGLSFAPDTWQHYAWSVLHQKNVLPLAFGFEVRTTYPILPIVGIALAGYWLGAWLHGMPKADTRRRFVVAGSATFLLFLLLRISNFYGDASQFAGQHSVLYTLFSLGNVTKYPISLQFALMTLGPVLLVLGMLHGREIRSWGWLRSLGQTPFFYYVAHLYLLHFIALLLALAAGYPMASFQFGSRFGGIPEGFGFPLWATLLLSASAVVLLIPACRWYRGFRARGRHPWLSFL